MSISASTAVLQVRYSLIYIRQYKSDALADRLHTSCIIVHHSASDDVSAEEIYQWHLDQGWSGIGYHFVIRKYGTIERGRQLNKIGAHAGSEPEIEQIEALLSLIDYLEEFYGKKLTVLRHCDVYSTACPGSKFPWPLTVLTEKDDWKKALVSRALEEKLISEEHDPGDKADKWFVLAVCLNLLDRKHGD